MCKELCYRYARLWHALCFLETDVFNACLLKAIIETVSALGEPEDLAILSCYTINSGQRVEASAQRQPWNYSYGLCSQNSHFSLTILTSVSHFLVMLTEIQYC